MSSGGEGIGGGDRGEGIERVLHDLLEQLVMRIVESGSRVALPYIVDKISTTGNRLGQFREIISTIFDMHRKEIQFYNRAEGVVLKSVQDLMEMKRRVEFKGGRIGEVDATEGAEVVGARMLWRGKTGWGRRGRKMVRGGAARKVIRDLKSEGREDKVERLFLRGGGKLVNAQFVGTVM